MHIINMKDIEIIDLLRKMPLFGFNDIKKYFPNTANDFVNKLIKSKHIFKLKKGLYSCYNDPYILANYLVTPSYITSVSALSHYGLIDQLPHDIISFTSKKTKSIKFNRTFFYYNTKYFFGFKEEEYNGFKVRFALPEKAVLDSFFTMPLEYFVDVFDELNIGLLKTYLKKINDISLNKRVGYILEKKGIDVDLFVKDYNYVLLNPTGPNKGSKNKKWHIIENYGDL